MKIQNRVATVLIAQILFICVFVSSVSSQVFEIATLDQAVNLSGYWKFAPLDDPAFSQLTFDDSKWELLHVPTPWGRQGHFSFSGVGWYRLNVRLNQKDQNAENEQIGVTIGKIADSYELYVNGQLLGGAGSLPPDPKFDYDRERTYLIPTHLSNAGNQFVIALRVWKSKSTSPWDGGPFEGSFLLGPSARLIRSEVIREIPPLILVVLFVMVGLNHLKLYLRRRELKEYLWFGISAFDMAIYTFLRSQWKYSLTDRFVLLKDLEYISLYLMPVIFIQFLWPLLSKPIGKLLRTFQALSLLLVLAIILAPGIGLNVRSLYWWELSAIPVIVAALILILREAWRGHPEARTLALGVFCVLVAALNDIGVDRGFLATPRIITFGFAAFLFSMVISLDNKFTRLFSEVDSLRHDLENRVADRTRELAQANMRLNEMDAIKTKFFANISHEFRTPLTLTIGPIENALAGAYGFIGGELQTNLEMMLRNSRRLLRMINELLEISKIESGKMQLNAKPVNVVKFVREITSLFNSLAQKKNIQLEVQSDSENIELYLDQEKFEKICYNLLSNAFKFVPSQGRIRVTISEQDVVTITFKDTGKGIPPEEIPYMFDRFHQVKGSFTKDQEGTGIGLSLVKDLVELHDGNISVKSEAGWGSEFSIRLKKGKDHLKPGEFLEISNQGDAFLFESSRAELLPLDFLHAKTLTEVSEQSSSEDHPLLLLVDDSKDVRDYVKGCLKNAYRIEEAGDGKEALALAATVRPDLIISDVMMPQMDGYQFCKAVKSDNNLKHIPIVLLTAKASEEMKVEGLEAGADDYVSKPFNAKELTARIKNLLQIRRQEKELKSFNEQLEKKVQEQVGALLKSKRLAKYLPSKLAQKIIADDEELMSERRNMTIFFSDISQFSDLSDRTEPETITEMLNGYFAAMVQLIESHGGTLGRFMGDGILGFFGAPDKMDPKDQARNSVLMAVGMQKKMKELSESWVEKGIDHALKIRIGIHQEYVTVGNFGSADCVEYTVIGNGANLANRLESACTPGRIHVSFPIYSLTRNHFPYEALQEREFKGFARLIRTCELNPDDCG